MAYCHGGPGGAGYPMNAAFAALLHNPLLWRGDDLAQAIAALPTGFAALDRELPGGGWPRGGLTELLADGEGIGELRLLLPALQRVVHDGAWIALVAPPHIPYAPAFAGYGIDPARVIVIAAEDRHRWWAAEQVLRANCAGALLFWPRAVSDQRLRRLQLAAQEGEAPAFVFAGTAHAAHASPAPLRIRISVHIARAAPPATQSTTQSATQSAAQLRLDAFKRRGGVMSQPLLLDVPMMPTAPQEQEPPITEAPLPRRIERLMMNRPPSFHRRHAVGAPRVHVWNRALARADEVRRVPGPDPRGAQPPPHIDPQAAVPAMGNAGIRS